LADRPRRPGCHSGNYFIGRRDPVDGLLIYRGRGGGAGEREPRRPKPALDSAAATLPASADESYLDLATVSAPSSGSEYAR
jgi:hypothetical protein